MATGGAPPTPKPPSAPRIRIPVHVLVYSIMLTPVAGYYAYYRRHRKSDEELEEELATNEVYRKQITDSQSKRQDMVQFLDNLKRGDASPYPGQSTGEGAPPHDRQQRMMDEMLRAGKSDGVKKRMYAVDESLYGTEEGARLAREAREGQEREKERRRKLKHKKKKKKRDEKNEDGRPSEVKGSENRKEAKPSPETTPGVVDGGGGKAPKFAVAALAGTAIVAAIGFVVGGRRR